MLRLAMTHVRFVPLALVLVACGAASPRTSSATHDTPRASSEAPVDDAAAGVHDEALATLLRDHWAATLEDDPVLGTLIGDHRRDGEMPDPSPAAEARRREARAAFLARARALRVQDDSDRLTLALFLDTLTAETGSEVCDDLYWSASPMDNPIVALNRVAPIHAFDTVEQGRAYLSRLSAWAPFTDQVTANLIEGASRDLVAPHTTLERLVAFGRGALAAPVESWVAYQAPAAAVAGWPEADRSAFLEQLRAVLEGEVRPAFQRYVDRIEADVLPHGRDAAHEGVASLPNGAACYAAEIRRHTTAARTAEELHQLGLSEIARTDARLLELGARTFSSSSVTEVLEHLRSDPSLGYTSGDEILADATARVREAEARAPSFFGLRADTACDVEPVPASEASSAGFAFYMPGAPDGSRAGRYYVNTAEPASRRRHLVAAVTAHEAVPGHHFQITVAYGLPAMPAFRRYAEYTAYVEGWGLYAERLADEMGLYHDDVDRLGAIDLEAFRAARLVVDTGLHAMGWSRAQAETYLREHTSMSADLVVNEVDRYINWPGQALAYKVGQLAFLASRAEAEAALGDRFDARAFHDLVLGLGPVSLTVLESAVHDWIATQR
jgi:uncharacterized protein (DUF885 family)